MDRRRRESDNNYEHVYHLVQELLDFLCAILPKGNCVWDENEDAEHIKPMLRRLNIDEEKLDEAD